MASNVDLKTILTTQERRSRKIWLILFLISSLLSIPSAIEDALDHIDPGLPLYSVAYVFIPTIFVLGIQYLFCYYSYKKFSTFFIKFLIILTWIWILFFGFKVLRSLPILRFESTADFIHLLAIKFRIDSKLSLAKFMFSKFLMIANLIFSQRLCKINDILKCYAKFPNECLEVTVHMRQGAGIQEIHSLFQVGMVKWPYLKELLERERNMRMGRLSAVAENQM